MVLKTLQCCGNASSPEQRSALRGTHTLNPQKLHLLSQGVVAHPLEAAAQSAGLMWGTRGPFLPAVAMVVEIVMPVVFCAKATEKCNKNTKISCL